MRIFVVGGLGNQLFLYSFGHFLQRKCPRPIDLVPHKSARTDRKFILETLLGKCEHLEVLENSDLPKEIKIRVGLVNRLKKFGKFGKLLSYFLQWRILLEQKEFSFKNYTDRKLKKGLAIGYFQNWRYIEPNLSLLSNELTSALKDIEIPVFVSNLLNQEKMIVVVHFRVGPDIIGSINDMGVLHEDYYINEISRINDEFDNVFVLAITDDLIASKNLMANVPVDFLIGPSELNEIQCLKLMMKADYVIAANSTFSWWGAVLAHSSGGGGSVPTPWFKNWHDHIGDAFEFPGLQIGKSIFLEKVEISS